jgi:hypothetical protein
MWVAIPSAGSGAGRGCYDRVDGDLPLALRLAGPLANTERTSPLAGTERTGPFDSYSSGGNYGAGLFLEQITTSAPMRLLLVEEVVAVCTAMCAAISLWLKFYPKGRCH